MTKMVNDDVTATDADDGNDDDDYGADADDDGEKVRV